MNLYFVKATGERVILKHVLSCGIVCLRSKQCDNFYLHIGDIAKVY